jgi:TolB protein
MAARERVGAAKRILNKCVHVSVNRAMGAEMNRRKAVLRTLLGAALAAGVAATVAQATVSAASAKNGQIVYRHFHSLFVVNADGTGERKLTKPPGGRFVDDQPDWSPDGSTIAFNRCTSSCHVFTVSATGAGLRQLGPNSDDRSEPAWAPNGKQLAYSRFWGRVTGDQFEQTEIYVMNANGGGARAVTSITRGKPFSADVFHASWSPDGAELAFEVKNSKQGEPAGRRAVFVVGADGSDLRQLTPWELNGSAPDWSPDGKLILLRVVGAKEQHGNIYTVHPDGSGLKQLTRYPAPKTLELGSFSPDGKWITFSRFSSGGPYPDVFAIRLDGSGVRQITKSGINFAPDWGRAR